jgi:type I restriction enzyme S subunit
VERIGTKCIPFPEFSEQQLIVHKVEARTGTFDTAIARTEREIALMQEYRTRLTADIVTGKLDVREVAAKLPDVSATPAPEPADGELDEPVESENGDTDV